MRRFPRPELDQRASRYLQAKTNKVLALPSPDRKKLIDRVWQGARQTKTVKAGVLGVLVRMAGNRARCMYCEDSRGTEIDHFWPSSVYPEHAFDWLNMLLSCSGCQGPKGNRFPLDDEGRPLLIDPTAEEPWEYLFFVPEAGVVTARFDPTTKQESAKGKATTEILPLNVEAITSGRKRLVRNLRRAVLDFLNVAATQPASHTKDQAIRDLIFAVQEDSERGVASWFFLWEGREEEPFRRLKNDFPDAFQTVVQSISQEDATKSGPA